MKTTVVLAAALAGVAQAQVGLWGQCGGIGYTGSTSCVSGASCNVINPYYSQCIAGSNGGGQTTTKTTTARTTSPTTRTTTSAAGQSTGGSGTGLQPVSGGASGSGKTTRYWDCCKPSCAWSGKGAVTKPVDTCDANGNRVGVDTKSACDGGTAYMCNNQVPRTINNNVAYGFAAVSIAGRTESNWCCACYELTLTSGPAAGKKYVVQATNTGGDLGSNHFDLAIPGGGFGIFDSCTKEFPGTPASNWGQRYGGVSSRDQCSGLPSVLQAGCQFRFDWFANSDNPSVNFVEVKCPSELTSLSGCART